MTIESPRLPGNGYVAVPSRRSTVSFSPRRIDGIRRGG